MRYLILDAETQSYGVSNYWDTRHVASCRLLADAIALASLYEGLTVVDRFTSETLYKG